MLRPEVIRDLGLGAHGLRMVPVRAGAPGPSSRTAHVCRGGRARAHRPTRSPRSRRPTRGPSSASTTGCKRLAALPPAASSSRRRRTCTRRGWAEGQGGHARATRGFRGSAATRSPTSSRSSTGTLGDFLDRSFESDKVKTLFLANNVYGMHGGPYRPGTAIGLLFHLLSGGERRACRASTATSWAAWARSRRRWPRRPARSGAEIRTSAPVARDRRPRTAAPAASCSRTARRSARRRRGLERRPEADVPRLVERQRRSPEEFRRDVAGIKMDGPCAKVNLALSEEPRSGRACPRTRPRTARSLATLVPSLERRERCYDSAQWGEIPEELWVDCVVASNVDATLAPDGRARDDLLRAVRAVRAARRDVGREARAARTTRRRDASRGTRRTCPDAIVATQVLTPLDLERIYGLTEGNIFHGDLTSSSSSSCGPCPAGRATGRRSTVSTSAAPARTRAAA